MSSQTIAIGIDIGGTGIKGGLVDLDDRRTRQRSGEAPDARGRQARRHRRDDERDRRATRGRRPGCARSASAFPRSSSTASPCRPRTCRRSGSASHAEELFEKALGRDIHFVNDADAAGYAESQFGAAKDKDGLVILTTLGTGIGSALIYNGVLIPNAELGHLEIDGARRGIDAPRTRRRSAKTSAGRSGRSACSATTRTLEFLFTPDLFIVGGGVSKNYQEFLPLLDLKTADRPGSAPQQRGHPRGGSAGGARQRPESHGA